MPLFLKKLDWVLVACVLFLAAGSLLILYSISLELFWRQALWFGLGFLIIFLFSQIDWRPLVNYQWVIYGIYILSVIVLLVTLFLAPSIRGIRSWLVIGPLRFQTSEFAKLALIIVYAYFFSSRHIGIAHLKNILIPFVLFSLPAGLIILQPDLGSALVLFVLWFGFLLVSGIRWKHIAIGLMIFLVIGFFGWHNILKDYHRERIIGFVYPEYDQLGINYSVIQSKIAIGSAGLWGDGFRQGTQTQLGFLPEAPTDFIFAAFVEEWGLFGGFLIIIAFVVLMLRVIKIGFKCENNFSKLICLGAAIFLMTHFILNIGSAIGFLPVVGISLPLFSYGGSNLLISATLIAIIQSIVVHPFYRRPTQVG